MPRAMFTAPADADDPSISGTSAPTASTSMDDGGKQPWSRAPRAQRHHRVPSCAGHVLLALRIIRENAAARMMGANARPQGYYKHSDKQKKFKCKPGTQSLREIWFYQKSTALMLICLPFLHLIRKVAQDFHFTAEATYTLQCASKDYLV